MAKRVKPDYSVVWAELGAATKPVDSYIQAGWLAVKPPRQYMNWIQNRQDSMLAYLNQAGIPEWNDTTAYEGDFSYVQGSDNRVYKCLLSNTNKNPTSQPANASYWKVAFVENEDSLLRPKGTASAPSYSFSGDTNTGVNSAAADTLTLVTGGVNRLTVTNTGVSVAGNLDISGTIDSGLKAAIANIMYPVGSIYSNISDSTNPATLFGVGTWVAIEGRVVVGLDPAQTEFDTAGETGGEKTHTLTQAELPAYNIAFQKSDVSTASPNFGAKAWPGTGNNPVTENVAAGGSGQAHNNLQPYVVAYVWKRTA